MKMDNKGNAYFGIVMEVKVQTETWRGVVNANALFNGSLNNSVNWECLMTKAKSSTVESQISLEL
jgi:hypothetical protein